MTPAQIKKYRDDKALSQQQLAELLGVDQATVSRIERGAVPARPVAILLHKLIVEHPRSITKRPAPKQERVA